MACSTVRLCPIQNLHEVTLGEVENACKDSERTLGQFLVRKEEGGLQTREMV